MFVNFIETIFFSLCLLKGSIFVKNRYLKIKKIHILLLKSFLGPQVMTFFVSLFILVMQFLWKYVDDMVGKGLEWYLILKLLFYASATFVPLALPLSILLSSLMTFGNLSERNEIVAMKSSGIPLWKIMQSLIILVFFVSIFAFVFSNNILPIVNLKMGSLLHDIRTQKPSLSLKEGVYNNSIEGYVIKIGKKENDGKTINNVMIFDHTERLGNNNFTIAKSGRMEFSKDKKSLIFKLYNGYNYLEDIKKLNYRKRRPLTRIHFNEETRLFDLSSFALQRTNEEFFKKNFQMLKLKQLDRFIDTATITLNVTISDFKKNIKNVFEYYKTIDTNYKTIKNTNNQHYNNIEANNAVIIIALNDARSIRNSIDYQFNNIDAQEKIIIRHEIEWHRKLVLSVACFLLFFLGAPLGAIIKKGGFGLPVVVSTLLFVLYHVISFTGEKFVREGIIIAKYGMWISSLTILPLGLFLTYKASLDSPLFDIDGWQRFFKRKVK